VCAAALVAGCVQREISVSPADLESQRARLVAGGGAAVLRTASDTEATVRASDTVELVDLAGNHTRVRIADVLVDCPEHAGSRNQLCARTRIDRIILGHVRELDQGTVEEVSVIVVVTGALGGGVYCAIECGSPANYVADGLMLGSLALVIGVAYALRGYTAMSMSPR
jgi:hypothetical protein